VNVLPDGTVSARGVAGTGATGSNAEIELRGANNQGAVSADGSRIYFTPTQGPGPLYLRENVQAEQSALGVANECTEPSKACTVPVYEGGLVAIFWGASPDGAHAFYSTEGGENNLYDFDLATKSSTLIAGEITGVMGVAAEGNRIYFSSREAINGKGVAGKPNLYLFDSTKIGLARIQFVGTLTESDGALNPIFRYSLASLEPGHRVARISPNGLHAVFAAYAPLTGYDNTDTVSGEADLEVFVYDATANGGAGALDCVSCNPSGQPPAGRNVPLEGVANEGFETGNWAAALIPPPATSFYGSRVLTPNGNRVFFNSYESLLPADTNGKADVYEWEAVGSGGSAGGGCTEQSVHFTPQSSGCLSLISSGEGQSDSEFVDASPDGRDVFFYTASSLVPQDPGLIDIYDAREGGGFASPTAASSACEGEACQSASPPPQVQSPTSSTFIGPGNAKHHKKKHHKKKHHKKKSQKHSRKKGSGRASKDRRAGR
jgi:hypothetical protein